MSLNTALIIGGDASGAKKATDDTAGAIDNLGKKAKAAAAPLKDVATGLKDTAESAPKAEQGVIAVGTAAETSGGKMGAFKHLAMTALAGLAGGLGAGLVIGAFEGISTAFMGIVQSVADGTVKINADLATQESLIKRIRGAYAEAEGAASSYGNNSTQILRFEQMRSAQNLSADYEMVTSGLKNRGEDFGTNPLFQGAAALGSNSAWGSGDSPIGKLVADFRKDLQAGTADVIAFRNEVAQIAASMPEDEAAQKWADAIFDVTDSAAEIEVKLRTATDLLKALGGDSAAAATALGGAADKFPVLGANAQAALPPLQAAAAAIETISKNGGLGAPAGLPYPYGSSGYAAGGYTGHAPADQVAGFVHGQEYVFDAAATARIGVGNLEAIRRGVRGYAAGGAVGAPAGRSVGVVDIFGSLAGSFDTLRGSVSGLITDVISASNPLQALGSIAANAGSQILNFATGALDSLANKAFSAAGDGIAALFGFAGGGYTGDGSVSAPAGVVHRKEFVINAAATSRHRPLLEAINRGMPGYAKGGYVGGESMPMGSQFIFAPHTELHAEGSSLDQFKMLLDERDRTLAQHFNDRVAYALENPRR